jgi:hypothetical protein
MDFKVFDDFKNLFTILFILLMDLILSTKVYFVYGLYMSMITDVIFCVILWGLLNKMKFDIENSMEIDLHEE